MKEDSLQMDPSVMHPTPPTASVPPSTSRGKSPLRWLLAAALLGATAAGADQRIPFRSRGEIVLDDARSDFSQLPLLLRGHDVGRGTLLGQYTSEYEVLAWPMLAPTGKWRWVYAGTFVCTAADGATLTASLRAEAPMNGDGSSGELTATVVVLEGSGRLAKVRGGWTSRAVATPTGFAYQSEGEWLLPDRRGGR